LDHHDCERVSVAVDPHGGARTMVGKRELDLEDARNPHAIESATGNVLADPESEMQLK